LTTSADWKAALLTLSDGPFFDLMRTYLGDIRTPFNKQRLVDELEGFLGRKEIQETIGSYLDASDRLLVAALAQLGEPTADELAGFFEGEIPFAELHTILLNLEERLIIYRIDDGGLRRLALNPALAPVLAPIAADPSPLYPSRPAEASGGAGRAAVPDDLFLAAVVAYLRRLPDLFRADGEYRKRAAEEAALVFDFDAFAAVVDAFHALGVVLGEDEGVRIDEARLEALAALGRRERRLYFAAGLCGAFLERAEKRGVGRIARDRLALWARLFAALSGKLDPSRAYPAATILRLLELAVREAAAPRRRRWDARAADPGAELRGGVGAPAFRSAALRALETAGLLAVGEDGCYRAIGAAPDSVAGTAAADSGGSRVTVDAAFSVLVPPEFDFSDAVALSRFLDIREAGRVARYELTRDSAVRGFDRGLSPADILGFLERSSGRPVPQNVGWSVKEWHDRYSAVAVYRGVVLTVAEDRRFILETAQLSRLVARTLAPGVYLLNADEESEAVRALESAGCDIVALPSRPAAPRADEPGPEPDRSRFAFFADLGRDQVRPAVSSSAANAADVDGEQASGISGQAAERQTSLRAALDRKGLPKDQRDELAARVDRRVVLVESQLVGAAVRYEKLEAKGLDYVGKVRVAEQALSTGSLVELFWRGPKGEPNRALGSPVSLDKSGGEVELSLDPAPRGERIRIAVGKISLIRRIKRSIFGE
jgi:hypothetical protein